MAKALVVLGARNLGGAIIDHFIERGWAAAGVAQSEETLARVRDRGALALAADASDPESLTDALAHARDELGSLDAVVNAVTAARPPRAGPFGGGELAQADLEAFRGWTVAVAEQAFLLDSDGYVRGLRETANGHPWGRRGVAGFRGAHQRGRGARGDGLPSPGRRLCRAGRES